MKRNHLLLLIGFLILSVCPLYGQQLDMKRFKGIRPRSIGPAGMSGRVTSIDAVHENPDIIWAGTASGGLWKSESGGIAWKPVFDKEKVASIGAVAIQQSNPDVVWVGTGEGNPRNSQASGAGVYKTLDGGKNWIFLGLGEIRNIHRIALHPTDPNTVYVGAQGSAWGESEHRGVYKTTDGGKTWKKILFINNKTGVGDMIIDPVNPNKLLVAMWEFRRWPWFFESGGENSGLYRTVDGGENWTELTEEEGLPKGNLGRMGLALAVSRPNIIYALIESKKNALYKSEDGGFKWKKVSDKNIGNRPFYYADIYVDPTNENRIYNLYSFVSVSEDGGKTFKTLLPWSNKPTDIHPDHHAWYINPNDPDFLINGNDGGMAISRDRGKSWEFVDNLPLAQFYHINYDMETPYNVYGGMQDNGSWQGPAYSWRKGGIRNSDWEELSFGDGFDVVPDPKDSRYGYSMWQGGNLLRWDAVSGHTKYIKPIHAEGEKLRFNWNAGIAIDPLDQTTVYYGSQFLHKSTDKGNTWEIISPDLTTNDPEKQKQEESGGLTIDDTNAENFTTIVAIAPSPVKQGVIWVGTDDGNVQLTTDGGKTWENHAKKFKEVPEGSWVPQIVASSHEEGEAFVVINNYRRNDWTPFVYHTKNFGKSWVRMVDAEKVWGYCLSIAQDPIEPKLLFLGTEFGLYVSLDYGKNWSKWTNEYPTVSTMDLKIHPREHDLVIGTFGRAAFIMDDIRPLRELVQKGMKEMEKTVKVYPAPDAYLATYRQARGGRFIGHGGFAGENRKEGAMITFSINEILEKKKEGKIGTASTEKMGKTTKLKTDSLKVEVLDASAFVIRTFKVVAEPGMNRFYWDLSRKGIRTPSQPKPKKGTKEPKGLSVLPGTYTVKVHYGEEADSTTVNVKTDPRLEIDLDNLQQRDALYTKLMQHLELATQAADQLRDARSSIKLVGSQTAFHEIEPDTAFVNLQKAINKQIKELLELINPKEDVQGIIRNADIVSAKLSNAGYYLTSSYEPINANQKKAYELAEKQLTDAVEQINGFFEKDWKTYKEAVEKLELSLFKKGGKLTLPE